jgi:hypothetical protein
MGCETGVDVGVGVGVGVCACMGVDVGGEERVGVGFHSVRGVSNTNLTMIRCKECMQGIHTNSTT